VVVLAERALPVIQNAHSRTRLLAQSLSKMAMLRATSALVLSLGLFMVAAGVAMAAEGVCSSDVVSG
jgi:hypothetical protein